ncbi:MAG: response regulator transcription factor [Kutzneria sp.]|nr:response regulator transcription factor [Kutzneria sp.]MBV9843478.1 response regulator transcription factor [Kutzneria sp.]
MTSADNDDTGGTPRRPVRVFLVDDHALFRTGVRAELDSTTAGSTAQIVVVGEAGSIGEAVAGIARHQPDVVLLDVHMPDGGGAELLRRVRRAHPEVVFLALSVSDAAEDVIAVIRAGARGYVTKTISGQELAGAVLRVADGDPVFSPRLAGFVLDAFSDRKGATPVSDPELDLLTPRERDVLRLLARGYAYKEIASELFISVKTVETHVSSVLRKTQLSNRYELSRWATDRRLV